MYFLFGFAWLAGWVLGIIGFFSALSAHRELRRLRAMLATGQALPGPAASAGLASTPPPGPVAAPPWPRPAPPPESEPVAAAVPSAEPEPALATLPPGDFEAMLTTRWGIWLGSA